MPKGKCEGNKIERRSGGISGFKTNFADEAKCPNDMDICCPIEEIPHDCSEYAQDGYKCSKTCADAPQDITSETERISNVIPYQPKEAKCPNDQSCCKTNTGHTDPPCLEDLSTNGPANKCEDVEGYQCLEFLQCDPDKLVKTCPNRVTDTIDLLFDIDNLGGVTVDVGKSPCKEPNKVCCQPTKVTTPTPSPTPKCGVHNSNGLSRVKYVSSDPNKPVSSQFGEWPHACIVLKAENEEFVGGASLITPKTVVTAAHIIKYVLMDNLFKCIYLFSISYALRIDRGLIVFNLCLFICRHSFDVVRLIYERC